MKLRYCWRLRVYNCLLIAPEGIEIVGNAFECDGKMLLIAPEGIEICHVKYDKEKDELLLIAPEGIEMKELIRLKY